MRNGFPWGRRSVVPETPLGLAERLEELHADPRRVHTSETPVAPAETPAEPAAPEMSPEEVQAAWDALAARVEAMKAAPVVKPARPAAGAPVDLDAMVDARLRRMLAERDRAEAAAAARAEWEEQQRLATAGGPCKYCGASESWERDEHGKSVGHWYSDVCALCDLDRSRHPGATDLDWRAIVAEKLLPREVTRWWTREHLLQKVNFKFWHETPGAPTSATKQYAYVNIDAMVEALTHKPPTFEVGDPCGRCGAVDRWFRGRTARMADNPQLGLVETVTCWGCKDAGDLARLIASATGLRWWVVAERGDMMSEAYGITWWKDSTNGGKADPPRPCATPFEYIDFRAAKLQAWRWHKREGDYGGWATWQAVKKLAES